MKFRDYAKDIAENKATMGVDAASAFFSMTQAEYAAGNFKQKVAEGTLTARVRVGAGINNVAGVKLPVFSKYETNVAADNQSLGLAGGGKKIAAVREKFTTLLEKLIKLASLQTSFVTLDEALKVTNRRVNALENVTIPKIEAVLDYIARELDELEREGKLHHYDIILWNFGKYCIDTLYTHSPMFFADFTRLKLVQAKKKDQHADEERRKKLAGVTHFKTNDEDITAVYDIADDADVVF